MSFSKNIKSSCLCLAEFLLKIKGLEHLSSENRLTNMGFFSMKNIRLWGELIVAFQYLNGVYKREGNQLFTRVGSDRTRGNGFRLKEERFSLD